MSRWIVARRATQLSFLALFAGSSYAGIRLLSGTLSSSRIADTIPLADPLAVLQMLAAGIVPASTALFGAAIVTGIYAILFGRAFCGWVCPVNIVTETANSLGRRLSIRTEISIPRSTRFWFLGLTLLTSAATGVAAFELVSPIGIAVRAVVYGAVAGWFVLLAIFLYDLLIHPNGFCGHICPLGAFYSLIGKRALLHVRLNRDACNQCMKCSSVCPERPVLTPLLKSGARQFTVRDSACTQCAQCVDVCDQRALSFSMMPARWTPAVSEERHAIQ